MTSMAHEAGTNLQCGCGESVRLPADAAAFRLAHSGKGHRVDIDRYRASCRPELGCRQCGKPPGGRFRFYCSEACRDSFEEDHFWSSASKAAWRKAPHDPATGRARCSRCNGSGPFEVNHVVPVNGRRSFFSCLHHQGNLELLCRRCHVAETRAQRRLGQIGGRAR